MNGAHWHLAVNHLPIIFPIVGVIVMLTGFVFKVEVVRRTALLIFIWGALTTLAAMGTGEDAEEVVENISGVSKNYIEHHEETAEIFAMLSYLLGGFSALGLWASFKQKRFTTLISGGILIYALVVLFYARQTGTTGGEIRHTEIRVDYHIPATEKRATVNGEDN